MNKNIGTHFRAVRATCLLCSVHLGEILTVQQEERNLE